MSYQFIQLSYLDTISSGDIQLRQTLLEMAKTEIQSALPAMHDAFQKQHWDELHDIAHKLKSTLAFAGNPELTLANQNILSNLELAKYEADFAAQLNVFQQLSEPVLTELKKELDACQLS